MRLKKTTETDSIAITPKNVEVKIAEAIEEAKKAAEKAWEIEAEVNDNYANGYFFVVGTPEADKALKKCF